MSHSGGQICPTQVLMVYWQSSSKVQRSFSCDNSTSNQKKQWITWRFVLSWMPNIEQKREMTRLEVTEDLNVLNHNKKWMSEWNAMEMGVVIFVWNIKDIDNEA